MNQLIAYRWPENIRELQSIIEQQVIVVPDNNIVFDGMRPAATKPSNTSTNVIEGSLITKSQSKQQDHARIIAALKHSKGKVLGKNGGAALLQVKPNTLSSRIKKIRLM